MAETNIILKVQTFTFTDPIITVELTMSKRSDALDIADKLNDIAKAKKWQLAIIGWRYFVTKNSL